MSSGNHPPAYYAASISFSYQTTYYSSGDKRPRTHFEADNGTQPALPSSKRQRRFEGPTSKSEQDEQCSLYLSVSDQGRIVEHFPGEDKLEEIFRVDNSSRVVELDDDDSIEDDIQQQAAPIRQQPQGRQPPVLATGVSDRNDANHGRYIELMPYAGSIYSRQPLSGSRVAGLPYEEDLERSHGSNPAPSVDAGLGSRSNLATSSMYSWQWATQEGYHDWQRAVQASDALEHSHGKLT